MKLALLLLHKIKIELLLLPKMKMALLLPQKTKMAFLLPQKTKTDAELAVLLPPKRMTNGRSKIHFLSVFIFHKHAIFE